MNITTDARGALRDLFQFHYTSQVWLPALFVLVAVGALAALLAEIVSVQAGPGYEATEIRLSLAFWSIRLLAGHSFQRLRGRFRHGSAPRAEALRRL
jgi:hypothetical protein